MFRLMNRFHTRYLSAFVMLLFGMLQTAFAEPIFHAIIAGDTVKRKDTSQDVSADIMHNVGALELWLMLNAPEKSIDKHVLIGKNWNQNRLMETIDQLNVDPNDTILFFYSGHGYFNQDPNMDRGHIGTLFKPPTDDGRNLWLSEIHERIMQKKPRFFLSVADCCSIQPSQLYIAEAPSAVPRTDFSRLFRSLFLDPTGVISINSSKPDEYAVGGVRGKGAGSLFTNAFLAELRHPETEADWGTVIDAVRKRVDEGFRDLLSTYSQQDDPSSKFYLLGGPILEQQATQTVWAIRNNKIWFKY